MEQGAHSCYKFVSAALVCVDDWSRHAVRAARERGVGLSVGYVVVCGFDHIAMALSGYFIASRLNSTRWKRRLSPAVIAGWADKGMGNSSASNRVSLMPFAQIATRIGGASTVIFATRWAVNGALIPGCQKTESNDIFSTPLRFSSL